MKEYEMQEAYVWRCRCVSVESLCRQPVGPHLNLRLSGCPGGGDTMVSRDRFV